MLYRSSDIDQQSSSIGRKKSCVLYCIVRTQDGYVLSRGEVIWKSVAKTLDFFWLTNLWWRSTDATIIIVIIIIIIINIIIIVIIIIINLILILT